VRHIATSATMADPEGGDSPAKRLRAPLLRRRRRARDAGARGLRRAALERAPQRARGPPCRSAHVLTALLKAVDAPDEQVADARSRRSSSSSAAPGSRRAAGRRRWPASSPATSSSTSSPRRWRSRARWPSCPTMLAEAVGRPVPRPRSSLAGPRRGHRPGRARSAAAPGGAQLRARASAAPWSPSRALVPRGCGSRARTPTPSWRGYRRFPVITCTTCGQHYYETWVKDFASRRASRPAPGRRSVGSARARMGAPEEATRGQPRAARRPPRRAPGRGGRRRGG
jgi:hypothetical protein